MTAAMRFRASTVDGSGTGSLRKRPEAGDAEVLSGSGEDGGDLD